MIGTVNVGDGFATKWIHMQHGKGH